MADRHHPIPTAIKELRGNPGKRALNADEPQPEKLFELPECPDHIGAWGKREWDRVGPKLIKMGLLAETDLQTFEAYCLNVQLMIEAREEIQRHGMLVMGARGRVRNPAIAAFSAASTAVRGFASEFGLTPSSRTRIKLPSDDADPLAGLMAVDEDEDFGRGV